MSCFTQRFTGVGVSVERGAENNGAWKAPGSHVSVSVAAKRSVSDCSPGWEEGGGAEGPCLVLWVGTGGRPRREKHTSASLPYPRRGENTETEFAKLVLFFLSKTSFALLSHSGWALGRSFDFQGLCRPWARVFPSARGELGAVPRARRGLIKARPHSSQLYTQL